ncbi:MAG: prepilin peptidase [Cyanobacteria bacterium]|nr:prepilin peptidase [Cyanobacteriota bacterium]
MMLNLVQSFSPALAIIAFFFGSFANVLIYRVPLGHSILTPRSYCPSCGHQLLWYENIPLVSYVFLKGACSQCKTIIPITYPIVEAIVGMLGIFMLEHVASLQEYFFTLILITIAVALGFIDVKHHRLPHALTYTGTIFVVLYISLFSSPFYDSVPAYTKLPDALGELATGIGYYGLSILVIDALTHTANLFYFKEKALHIASSGICFRNEFLAKYVTWLYLILTAIELFLAYKYPLTIFFWFNLALGLSYLVNEICIDYVFANKGAEETDEQTLTVFGGGDASFLALMALALGPVIALMVFIVACYIALFQVILGKIKSFFSKDSVKLTSKYTPLGGALAFAFIAAMMILETRF